ncbi:MAG: DUF2840 domain-containing protein [Rhodopila sp.]|nr:DUF2840 domain-containing protein [Rhodopila sp.]
MTETTPLTTVELVFYRDRIERWLRFGRDAGERILDRRRRLILFAPGTVFGFVRWEGNEHGTLLSRIDIVRACNTGEPISTVPGVTPGGDILLRLSGWPRVKRVLDLITAIEQSGIEPANVAPEYWRHVHNRIAGGQQPRLYRADQHNAWLRRARGEA